MPFEPIEPEKLSVSVTKQIEILILRGILRPAERLPSERDLAAKLNVSRPSLREAIAELQQKGLLTSKANSGIYVADVLGSAFSAPLIQLFSENEEALFDYLAFRRDLEGLAARRAAKSATETDLRIIATIFDKMQDAYRRNDPEHEAALDADFHLAIVEAAHNVVMLHMMRSMFSMLKAGVFYNRQIMFEVNTTREMLIDQHRAIKEAILARDPDAAQRATIAHLDFVEAAMIEHRKQLEHEAFAKRRFAHEKSKQK